MKAARKAANFALAGLPLGASVDAAREVVETSAGYIARAIMAERERFTDALREADRHAVKVEGLLDGHIAWEEERPPIACIEAVKNYLDREWISKGCETEHAFGCASCQAVFLKKQLDSLIDRSED